MHAIVFDFDGTLVDTEPLHELALAAACRPHGVPVAHGSTIGLADEDALINAFAAAGKPITLDHLPALKRVKTDAYLDLVRTRQITVYDGALELLRAAAVLGPVGICTAAVREEVDAVLGRLGIADALGAVVTATDVAAKKPDPEGYTLIASRLRIPPERCVAIEDSPRGVESARRAGMVVVGVEHTTSREHLSEAHEIRAAIRDLRAPELIDLVRTKNAPARSAHGGVV